MRNYLIAALALAVVASPLQAQKRGRVRHDPNKITAEELAEYGDANMTDVLRRARPNFFIFKASDDAGMAIPTVTGMQYSVLVYVGTQQEGDTSMLRFHKANELAEVIYFKPGNALSPQSAGNAYVIQLVPKDEHRSP